MKKDVYQIITERIIHLLESGRAPWRCPWNGPSGGPQNYISRKPYRGINLFLLNAAGFVNPYWLTFRQVQTLGGLVKKGEKSFPVVFWKILEEDENGEIRKIPFLRYHGVFNIAQCEGIKTPESKGAEREFRPIERCEEVVAQMPRRPLLEHGGNCAAYWPATDRITMPEAHCFETPESYFNVLFHELTHSTGHVSRLNRKEVNSPNGIKFGSDPYSREELVAEMGAAFLCGHCHIEGATLEPSADYIQSWLRKLKEDHRLVVHAAAQAQKACDFILDVRPEADEPVKYEPKEYKVVALRDCPTPESMQICETPEHAADYWNRHIVPSALFNPECECLTVLLLNSRRRIKGHLLLSIGTVNTILVHPREVFRAAIIASASSIVLTHNHPSGDPQPSAEDIKTTCNLIRAGVILGIEVMDHIIMGHSRHRSLRDLGYFGN